MSSKTVKAVTIPDDHLDALLERQPANVDGFRKFLRVAGARQYEKLKDQFQTLNELNYVLALMETFAPPALKVAAVLKREKCKLEPALFKSAGVFKAMQSAADALDK